MAGDFPDIPFRQAAGDGGPRSHTQVVVIHATDNATASAADEAAYATHREDGTSAHFYSDTEDVYQGVRLGNVAYGCLWHGNQISVQFELCGRSNHLSDATLRRIAPVVKRVCTRYNIPIRKIGPSDVRNGVKGVCGHGDITKAFPADGGDHTDPGTSFPWATFIRYIQGEPTMAELDREITCADGKKRSAIQVLGDIFNIVYSGTEYAEFGPPSFVPHMLKQLDNKPGLILTGDQVRAMGEQLAAEVVAHHDALTDADLPVIQHAADRAVRTVLGTLDGAT